MNINGYAVENFYLRMDPSRGDSRYNLNYSMNSIGLSLADQADLYGNPAATAALISRPPSSGLIQPMIGGGGGRNSAGLQMSNSNQCQTLNNTSAGQQQARGIKRTSSDCYEEQQQQAQIHRTSNPGMTTLQGLESCGGGGGPGGNGTQSSAGGAEVSEESYSSITNKKSPPANGKKTKGRVKIKMEYIDNKLRRYTTFSKRKTGIMKKVGFLSFTTYQYFVEMSELFCFHSHLTFFLVRTLCESFVVSLNSLVL